MIRLRVFLVVATTLLTNLCAPPTLHGAERPTSDWLRLSGEDLQICLRGEVFDPDGQPASQFLIDGKLNSRDAELPFEPIIKGSRFEIWIPVNRTRWYSLRLRASSSDGKHVAFRQLTAYELRQAAIEGIALQLHPPTRTVEVQVMQEGRPVAEATVKAALGFGVEIRAQTEEDGIARLGLLPKQKLDQLTAWTEDYRIGGYGFSRKPARDPEADVFVVELSNCRDQTLRFIDEAGTPVPAISFRLQIATAPPNHNYIGTNENSSMTTDSLGEAVCKWFPDWESHHFYPELKTKQWVLDDDFEMIDGTLVYTLKKATVRKRITGQVSSAVTATGGFFVTLRSFQGERENQSDVLSAFTDSQGKFSVEVLPDATYCAYALDSQWVGKTTDVIPYDSSSDQITAPQLSVLAGQKVEVLVTTGPKKRPYPNLTISFHKEHDYNWQEDGRTQSGSGGPQWWARTNDLGHATTQTLPGELEVSIYTPLWRATKSVDVREGEVVTIHLHREVEEKRTVTGRLVAAEGATMDFEGTEIEIGAVDGNYDDRQSLIADAEGVFTFETMASEIGVFAYSKDGKTAGSVVVKDFSTPILISMRRTTEFYGFLMNDENKPLGNHGVKAHVHIEGEGDYEGTFAKSFEAKQLATTTDEFGNYQLTGLPIEVKVKIFADAAEGETGGRKIEQVFLKSDE